MDGGGTSDNINSRRVVEWMQIAGAFSLNALIVCPVHGHGHHHHYVLLSIYVGITKGALFPPHHMPPLNSGDFCSSRRPIPPVPKCVCVRRRDGHGIKGRVFLIMATVRWAATTTQDGDCPWPSYHIVHPFILLRPFIAGRPHSVAVLAAVAT